MSGWIIFAVCFTTLLVGMWSAVTVLEFYRANRKMKEAEAERLSRRVPGRGVRSGL